MKIKWYMQGFEDVRRLDGVNENLKRRAEKIAEACGEGYEANVNRGKTRTRASVVTATSKAIRDNAANNTLIKNLGAGR